MTKMITYIEANIEIRNETFSETIMIFVSFERFIITSDNLSNEKSYTSVISHFEIRKIEQKYVKSVNGK